MPSFLTFVGNLKQLWSFISTRRKRQFLLLVLLALISAVSEVITIGLVIPFLSILTNPDVMTEFDFVGDILNILEIHETDITITSVTIVFASAALLSGLIRILMIYSTVKFSFSTGSDLAFKMYSKALNQEFKTHLNRNSSQIVNVAFNKVNLMIQNVIVTSITLISSSIIVIIIFTFLTFIKPVVTIGTLAVLGVAYGILIKLTRNRVFKNSILIASNSDMVIKNIQEGITGIREILLTGTQKVFSDKFRSVESELRSAQANNSFISFSPRYIIETFGIIVIVGLAFILHHQGSLGSEITLLGMLALTAQRILPLVNQSYFSYTCIRGEQASFEDILKMLSERQMPPPKNTSNLEFHNSIELNQISFEYKKNQPVLKDLTLSIKKGEKIGVVGKTASGKSTLADIISCLLVTTSGHIKIDNQILNENNYHLWQKKISYVSQAIFLNDNSIAENIAFGEKKSKINFERVKECATKSQLVESINKMPLKYDTIVGEKGVKLSGGQRQRLAIARALYRKCEFLILDEATSALDSETEKLVMDSIMKLNNNTTILVIAHRTTTLSECDRVIKLKQGRISFIGSYTNYIKEF